MPAQLFLTKKQVQAIADLDEDVVVTEGPPGAGAHDVWVMDEASLNSDTHRSVVIDPEGEILGDTQVGD